MRKIGRNIVRQKNMLRELYIWLWMKKLGRRWRKLIRVVMVVGYLELPNKGWGKRVLLRLFVLKMKVAGGLGCDSKCGWSKKIWKEQMEKLMNAENEWSDNIDTSKV